MEDEKNLPETEEFDPEEEREYWQKRLEEGDANGYYYLSRLCEYEGKMDESAKYFVKAIAAEQPDAMYWMSELCQEEGSDWYDPAEAENYRRKAADGGCVAAMLSMGDHALCDGDAPFYEENDGTLEQRSRHFAQFEWYKKAAEAGEAALMLSIADAYRTGYPVPVNPEKAFDWYMKGVEVAKDLACVCPVARCFEIGFGIEKDEETAVEYYELAAGYGVEEAIRRLSEIYTDGLGSVSPDPEKAGQYRKILEENGEN